MSIFATFVSSISFLGLPGDAYKGNWNPFVFSLSIPIATWLAAKVFIPLYRNVNSVSAYHYLELRFGYWARCYAAICYLLTQLARVGSILLLLALPLHTMFGWDVATIIVCTGIATLVYTLLGGIAAVVWTDAIQGIILIVGAVACALLLTFTMPEGPGQLFEIASAHGKFSLGSFGASLTEPTFWVVLIYGLFVNMQNYGIDQNYVQRYMTTKSTAEAVKSTLFGGLLYIPVSLVFVYIGTALFSYYTAQPELPRRSGLPVVHRPRTPHGADGPGHRVALLGRDVYRGDEHQLLGHDRTDGLRPASLEAGALRKGEYAGAVRDVVRRRGAGHCHGPSDDEHRRRAGCLVETGLDLQRRYAGSLPVGCGLPLGQTRPCRRVGDPGTADDRLDEPLAADQRGFALLSVPQPAAYLSDDRLRNDGHLPGWVPVDHPETETSVM